MSEADTETDTEILDVSDMPEHDEGTQDPENEGNIAGVTLPASA